MAEPSDAELLHAWVAGDRGCGAQLFDRHFAALLRFFKNKAGDAADDLIQKTFLGLVESAERFRGTSSVRTFVFSIARNVLYNHYRSRGRDRLSFDAGNSSAFDLAAAAGDQPTPSEALAHKREHRQLLDALRRIPLEAQMILELVYWERLKARELAEILDVPEGTARTRLRKAKQQCAAALVEARAATDLQTTLTRLDDWAAEVRASLD